MELKPQKFALASTITMGLIYFVCSIFVTLWPNSSLKVAGWIMHVNNLGTLIADRSVSFAGFFIGLAITLAFTYFGFYLFAWLYNRLNR